MLLRYDNMFAKHHIHHQSLCLPENVREIFEFSNIIFCPWNYFCSFFVVPNSDSLQYWRERKKPYPQYFCACLKRSKKYTSMISPTVLLLPPYVLHRHHSTLSRLVSCNCGESFSIINMIRFVIISSSDEQAVELLFFPPEKCPTCSCK